MSHSTSAPSTTDSAVPSTVDQPSTSSELSSLSSPTAIQHMSYFACSLNLDDLDSDLIRLAVRCLADTLACALAASPLAELERLRESAKQFPGSTPLWGTKQTCESSMAAMVNSAATRWLDANDLYLPDPPSAQSSGHCSDAAGGVFALVDPHQNTGQQLLSAFIIAYEIQSVLASCMTWLDVGFHTLSQINYAVPAAAAAFPQYELTPSILTNAIGLAASTGMCANTWLKQGKGKSKSAASSKSADHSGIPTIKSLAPGLACKRGIESLQLAKFGVSANPDALETILSFFNPPDRELDMKPFASLGQDMKLHRHLIKQFSAQFNLQAIISSGIELYAKGVRVSQIKNIKVYGHSFSCAGVQGSAEAFHPSSAGSADHSTPYVLISALTHGRFTAKLAYASEDWRKPELVEAMQKIQLFVDEKFEQARAKEGKLGCRIVVTLENGSEVEVVRDQTAGHPDEPLSDNELLSKMKDLLQPIYGDDMHQRIWRACWNLADSSDSTAVVELFELLATTPLQTASASKSA